ncbi:MAG: tRNA (adenosine(37)-N6)-threonylcarbamoyltransferase complex ATPase subunit type 1 TsaE [Candidatus Nanogingivalaceae bacterium]|nr:MAG: tRNA (adenosine(37)-N6)-threonylcarbamoyltransferase complex ATPase subunit type 1 TsaE [Candidatus Nanogingivalaceae bacterium]QWB91504.1 MAG: tRNA (adenosine(37)-N6)-threonylcarbamoyltransferase complex ATPase subunit type 1 TsaE [Candidatus Nanogingivalaceae bacterium]
MKNFEREINSTEEMIEFGKEIGSNLEGGSVLELIGDVGAGKTTFTKGLALGLGVLETVQSPTFTISRVYEGDNLTLSHYDFYRLNDYGIMKMELAENLSDPQNITVVEWAGDLADILPEKHLKLIFESVSEDKRLVKVREVR